MIDILLFLLYLIAGPLTIKAALARAERHYLRLADEAGRPQEKMDGEDWIGATIFAALAFAATPLLAVAWILRPPAKLAFIPVRAFLLPPAQHTHEVHVERLDGAKSVVLETAKTIAEVNKWKPDNESKKRMLEALGKDLSEHTEALTVLANPESPFDQRYMEQARMDVDRMRRGLALKASGRKELTA